VSYVLGKKKVETIKGKGDSCECVGLLETGKSESLLNPRLEGGETRKRGKVRNFRV